MNKILPVGTKLRTIREFLNMFDNTTVPRGCGGVIVAAGPDAKFGWYNMKFIYHTNGVFADHFFTGNLFDVAEVIL